MVTKFYSPFGRLFVMLVLFLTSVAAMAQSRTVTGQVNGEENEPLVGASVVVKGTNNGIITDTDGKFSISADANAVLVISFVGYKPQEIAVGGQSNISVQLLASQLEEVVVTGYTSQKKKDIVGSVAVIDTRTTLQQPSSNISNMLQGRAPGVTVSGTGAPGAAAKVRIRGFASFGNNDPLYIIDGVPTDNANALNPQDVESIQVLKDPVSASIYGSRAANGVIVVTTRQGKPGKTEISYDGYYGLQNIPDRAYPKMLNTADYFTVLKRTFTDVGLPFKSSIFQNGVPKYLVTSMDVNVRPTDGTNPDFTKYNVNPLNADGTYQILETSPGTDWFRQVSNPNAPVQTHQLSATGGTDKGSYSMGLNYFGSDGIFNQTNFNRFTLRANTRFKPAKWLTVGENFQLAYVNQKGSNGNPFDFGGGLDFSGEGNPWAQSYRVVPYIPVTDIKGNWGGNGMGESGNGTNPVAQLERSQYNRYEGYNFFGNAFAQVELTKGLVASSSFGIDQRFGSGTQFTYITYERAENQKNNNFGGYYFNGGSWTWTNSLQYTKDFNDNNSLKLFAATEAIREQFRSISASRTDYDFNDPLFWSIDRGKNLPQAGGSASTPRTLFSLIGKAEYQFMNRYLLSATIRRDAASAFGSENPAGIFPAVGLAWRISEEPFMKSLSGVTDLKLRAGWGQLGSQKNVSSVNSYSFYGSGTGFSGYDINGNNGNVTVGFRPDFIGNPFTKWETSEMVNIGVDGSLWGGKLDFTVEYFNNTTRDLITAPPFDPTRPNVGRANINIGTMLNRGVDASITTRGKITSKLSYDFGLTFTHFINEATKIDASGNDFINFGAGRLGNIQRIEAGHPISSFFGYINDGVFQTQAEVDAYAKMDYKRVGSWKLRDINKDGIINDKDQTFIGNPIPKFQIGTDISLKYGNFDFQTFLFFNYGNDLFNYTKWWTHLRGFVGGIDQAVLTDSWSPTNTGGKLPILNTNDTYSGNVSNSYYIESGTFLRIRQMQVGYNFPSEVLNKIGLGRARIYVQAQNLFTATSYSGPDPDIGILGGDLQMGVDQFRTPAPRTIIFGVNFALK